LSESDYYDVHASQSIGVTRGGHEAIPPIFSASSHLVLGGYPKQGGGIPNKILLFK